MTQLNSDSELWLANVKQLKSPNFDDRSETAGDVSLLVIHNISLPPAKHPHDFDNTYVEDFFLNKLDIHAHPIFKELQGVEVSAHLYIKRTGEVIQFVPLNKRAWHAGVSCFEGREKCNDFSIGIELQGTDNLPYTELQYNALLSVTQQIQEFYPEINIERIVGHCDIAPERKTDPGASFDWQKYRKGLLSKKR